MTTKKIEDGIREYLESLGQGDKPVVDREAVKALKAQIRSETDVINKAILLSELEREEAGRVPDSSGAKAVFVAEGKAWADNESITVTLNEDGTSKTTIAGVTVGTIAAPANTWTAEADIKASVDALNTFSTSLETAATSFGTSQALISVRKDFNSALSNILKTGASELTAADMDAEAANLMALQTSQQMASTALSIMQSTESTALRLLR